MEAKLEFFSVKLLSNNYVRLGVKQALTNPSSSTNKLDKLARPRAFKKSVTWYNADIEAFGELVPDLIPHFEELENVGDYFKFEPVVAPEVDGDSFNIEIYESQDMSEHTDDVELYPKDPKVIPVDGGEDILLLKDDEPIYRTLSLVLGEPNHVTVAHDRN